MNYRHLVLVTLLSCGLCQLEPLNEDRMYRPEWSSSGPNITLRLRWLHGDSKCSRSPVFYRVSLCFAPGDCTEQIETGQENRITIETSEAFPITFCNIYTVIVDLFCWGYEPYIRHRIEPGPGEIGAPRGVIVKGGNRSATIAWQKPMEVGAHVEISVCNRSSDSCLDSVFQPSINSEVYVVKGLSAGAEYTAKVTVCKEFKGEVHQSTPVSVDFMTDGPEVEPVNPSRILHTLSSSGPNVTVDLKWLHAPCSRTPSFYRVKLCSAQDDCSDEKRIGQGNTARFETTESFPLTFFKTYTAMVDAFCGSLETYTRKQIDTGTAELEPPREVRVSPGKRSATVTWRKPLGVGDYVQIAVCQKSSDVCVQTYRASLASEKLTFRQLSPVVVYNAKLSVCKEYKDQTYCSRETTVSFRTRQAEN